MRHSSSSASGQETEVARLTRERDEALEQQAATGELLKVISSSKFDLQPVLDTLLETATRLCAADIGVIRRRDGDSYSLAATFGYKPEWRSHSERYPSTPTRGSIFGRTVIEGRTVHIPDVLEDPEFARADTRSLIGFRAALGVPLLREGNLIGIMAFQRFKPGDFTPKQIELVETFAAQAVIAIENARLLNELRQRTTDLTESLARQTATSEVLQVMSNSTFDLEIVFDTLLETAMRLCESNIAAIWRADGDLFKLAASRAPDDFVKFAKENPIRPGRGTITGRTALEGKTVHIPDVLADPEHTASAYQSRGNYRSVLSVPLLRQGETIGVFSLTRSKVRPFSDTQIELVQNFAAQAVVAIENTRLLTELKQSLEQQTATADVLRVISSSPGGLEPVFEAILENATRICEAKFGVMQLIAGDGFRAVALHDVPSAYAEAMRHNPVFHPVVGHPLDRLAGTKQVVHITDVRAEQRMRGWMVELAGARTLLLVPMLKDNELVGVISIYRQEVRPFTDKQIELVQNFAAQAVIAIENARLLNELRQRTADLTESLEQQTATSQVLQVISSSPGDLEPVFASMLENAVRICEAKFGHIYRWNGDVLSLAATYNTPPAYEALRRAPHRPGSGSPTARAITTKTIVHVVDMTVEEAYKERDPPIVEAVELAGMRTYLGVPMLKENELIGVLSLYRQEVRPFTDKQIELVENFAAQAVIAIENARLLDDLNKLNQQLEHRVADQVGEIERMSRLRRFLPPQVADLIVASGTEKQLESHRREITALFCDLRGFTGFSESSDPEDVMALLADYHAAIGEIIIKYSGTLERYAGDGVMVVFNDPVPVENPALQAVLMALEMREAIGTLTETWHRWGHDIGFGIGIAHGFATLGTIGFEGRFDYAAIGTVSNVASRLCDEAKPGQILISPRVLTKVENAVTVEPVGEFTLKGIRRAMMAYNVLAASPSKPT